MSEIERYDERRRMIDPVTDSWTEVIDNVVPFATQIAHTEFVPQGLRGKDGAKVAAAIMTGRELGLPPMTALAAIHVINGKPGISAEVMRALVQQAGHEIVFDEVSTQRVKIKGRREGTTEWTTVVWTDADAKRAGLASNGNNYAKYPRQMLTARATTELCRLIFADVIHGLRSIEELETLGDEDAVIVDSTDVDETPAPAKKATVSRKKGRTVKSQPVDDQPQQQPQSGRRSPSLTRRGSAPQTDEVSATEPDATQEDQPADEPGTSSPDPAGPSPSSGGDSEETRTSDDADSGAKRSASTPESASPSDEDDDAVEAEIVEDDQPPITKAQSTRLHAGFGRFGDRTREQKLMAVTNLIGRDIETTNDLTKLEAGRVIDTVEHCETWEDLVEAVTSAMEAR